jgi:RNA polymerase sigma-70 factor (ECF subfamily)
MDRSASNEALMAAVRDGRLESLEVLFERHHRPLFGFARGWTGDVHQAEDVVQDTFARILQYRRSYRPGSPYVPWMLQIARNLMRTARGEPRTTGLDEAALLTATDNPEQDLERKRRREQLTAGLAELAEDQRELLLLSHVRELPREEIAGLLGITVNAAKVRIHRAVQALRQRINVGESREVGP